MRKLLHPNDYPVLAKIFNNSSNKIFILRAEGAIDIPDSLGCSICFFKTKIALLKAINYEKEGTIINETPLNIEENFSRKYPAMVLLNLKKPPIKSRAQKFNFFLNPDKTIRWLYSNQLQQPIFLNLYNTSSWKGKLFQWGCSLCYQLQIQWLLNASSVWVEASVLHLDTISAQLNNAPYAIFTGTTGENRKAIICYEKKGQTTQFLKIPLTKPAQKLIYNEGRQLQNLQSYDFEYLVHPSSKLIGNCLLVSNVRPAKSLAVKTLNNNHFLVLIELYSFTATTQQLSTLPVWTSILNDLSIIRNNSIQNNISTQQVNHLTNLLETLLERIDGSQFISVALAHGDFTPWNIYMTTKAAHVYDWELAKQLPLLYDCFHYLFQTHILINKKPFQEIKLAIDHLEQDEIVQSILEGYSIEFNMAYQFYLLHNTSYYLSRYIRQAHLHEQAHWLINTWIKAIESSLEASKSFVQ